MLPTLIENKKLKLAIIIIVVSLQLSCCKSQQSCENTYSVTEAENFCANRGTQCNTNTDCRGTKKTCNCDGKCGKTCFNLQLTCPDELSITNGQISYTNSLSYGSIATLTCDASYLSNQTTKTRRCLANKKWSGTSPTCTAGCGTPTTSVDHAYVELFDPAYPIGKTLNFKCNYGFFLQGDSYSECLATLKWSVPNFSCPAIQCVELALNNGRAVRTTLTIPENEFGTQVDYVCNKGYVLSGTRTNQCLPEGWRYSAPSCDLVLCPQPPSTIENGVLTNPRSSYTYLEEVTYECNSNLYALVGQKAVCDHEVNSLVGKWVNLPKCQVNPNCTFEAAGDKKLCAYTAVSWKTKVTRGASGSAGYAISPNKGASSATLTSPNVKFTSLEYCLQFNYKVSASPNDLKVEVTSSDGKTSAFNIPSTLAVGEWKEIQFPLTPKSTQTTAMSADAWNSTLQWKFTVSNIQSTMYIDDISLLSKICSNPTSEPTTPTSTKATPTTAMTPTTTPPATTPPTTTKESTTTRPGGPNVVTVDINGNGDGEGRINDGATSPQPKNNGLGTEAIVGIVIGAVAAVAIVIVVIYMFVCRAK